jgi:hypothetical protein
MVVRRWHKIVGTVFGVILALALIGDRVATVSINEMHSPDWHSSSVDQARANGVLVSRSVVEPLTVAVQEITGSSARTFYQWAADHALAFSRTGTVVT